MTKTLSPVVERGLQRGLDYTERLLMLILFVAFALRVWPSLSSHGFNALVLLSDGLVVAFILTRRHSAKVTSRPLDWAAAMIGTMLPMLAKPGGSSLTGDVVSAALMIAGVSFSLWAKASLRRSFGIAAANRGVVEEGPYRLLRHPMYAGYVLVHAGFLLANPLAWNFVIYGVALACQVVRILAEETLLGEDPVYAALMARVRFRLLPGVF